MKASSQSRWHHQAATIGHWWSKYPPPAPPPTPTAQQLLRRASARLVRQCREVDVATAAANSTRQAAMSGLDEAAVRAALSAMSAPPPTAAAAGGGSGGAGGLDANAVLAALTQVQERPLGEILAQRESMRANAQLMAQLGIENPPLAEMLRSPDPTPFVEHVRAADERKRKQDAERMEWIRRLEVNPFDVEAQRNMEQLIEQQNVEQNYQAAMGAAWLPCSAIPRASHARGCPTGRGSPHGWCAVMRMVAEGGAWAFRCFCCRCCSSSPPCPVLRAQPGGLRLSDDAVRGRRGERYPDEGLRRLRRTDDDHDGGDGPEVRHHAARRPTLRGHGTGRGLGTDPRPRALGAHRDRRHRACPCPPFARTRRPSGPWLLPLPAALPPPPPPSPPGGPLAEASERAGVPVLVHRDGAVWARLPAGARYAQAVPGLRREQSTMRRDTTATPQLAVCLPVCGVAHTEALGCGWGGEGGRGADGWLCCAVLSPTSRARAQDLRENVLRIGDAVVPFLGEGDVPTNERVGAGADEQVRAVSWSSIRRGGAGGEHGIAQMWDRREISASSYYDQFHCYLHPHPYRRRNTRARARGFRPW
jgi:hypothetical protein